LAVGASSKNMEIKFMAHPHEKLVVLLLGWRHGENGNYG
jgi:hypothetical protein